MQPLPIVRLDARGVKADAAEIDVLARLAVRLRRSGYQLRLLAPSDELLRLIALCGLSGALPTDPPTDQLSSGSTGPRC